MLIHYLVVPTSDISVRLVPPEAGLNFLGRVEVLYNETWGTVCDDGFLSTEAMVICGMLGFHDGSCYSHRAGLGRGSGEWYTAAPMQMIR